MGSKSSAGVCGEGAERLTVRQMACVYLSDSLTVASTPRLFTCIYIYTHTHTHTHTHTRTHTHTHILYISCVHSFTVNQTHTHIHTTWSCGVGEAFLGVNAVSHTLTQTHTSCKVAHSITEKPCVTEHSHSCLPPSLFQVTGRKKEKGKTY